MESRVEEHAIRIAEAEVVLVWIGAKWTKNLRSCWPGAEACHRCIGQAIPACQASSESTVQDIV